MVYNATSMIKKMYCCCIGRNPGRKNFISCQLCQFETLIVGQPRILFLLVAK